MAAAFMQAAETAHLKWNGTTWTRAHQLLGLLCLEERRRWFAAELLVLLGAERRRDDALVSVAMLGCAHGQPPPRAGGSGSSRAHSRACQPSVLAFT